MTDAELVQWAVVCLRSTKQNPDTVNKLVDLASRLASGVIVPKTVDLDWRNSDGFYNGYPVAHAGPTDYAWGRSKNTASWSLNIGPFTPEDNGGIIYGMEREEARAEARRRATDAFNRWLIAMLQAQEEGK